jgi:nitrite reductase (NADH) small subunit
MTTAAAEHDTAAGAPAGAAWHDVCALAEILPATGVCALIAGEQVAVVRTLTDALHALGNRDPTSRAMVLARGIVGDRGGIAVIASPITKAVFNLKTGACVDKPGHRVPVHEVRLRDGRVEVRLAAAGSAP